MLAAAAAAVTERPRSFGAWVKRVHAEKELLPVRCSRATVMNKGKGKRLAGGRRTALVVARGGGGGGDREAAAAATAPAPWCWAGLARRPAAAALSTCASLLTCGAG